MRTPLAPVVTVIMLGLGCGQTVSPTGSTTLLPSESPATLTGAAAIATAAHREGHTEPFRGTLEGAVTVTPLEPPFANVFIAATGHATHLGRFTVDVPHLVNFATATGEGSYTFTAANGDTLIAHFTGTADTSNPIFAIVEHATITAGTGRFTSASGQFIVRRLYDPAAGTTTGSFEGTIGN